MYMQSLQTVFAAFLDTGASVAVDQDFAAKMTA